MLGAFGNLHSNIENAARMEAMIASQTNWGSGFGGIVDEAEQRAAMASRTSWGSGFGGVADDFSKVINSLSQAVVQTVPALKGKPASTPTPTPTPSPSGGGGGGGGGSSKTWMYVGGAVALGVVGVLVYKKMKKRRR